MGMGTKPSELDPDAAQPRRLPARSKIAHAVVACSRLTPLRPRNRHGAIDQPSQSHHGSERPLARDQATVDVEVIVGHAARREAFLEDAPHAGAVE